MQRKLDVVAAVVGIIILAIFAHRTASNSNDAATLDGARSFAPEAEIRRNDRPQHSPTEAPIVAESRTSSVAESSIDRRLDLHGVVAGDDGHPIAGVRVRLLFSPTRGRRELDVGERSKLAVLRETLTDSRGGFRFRLRPGIPHDLEFLAPSYANETRANVSAGEFVAVTLRQGARLTGRVVYASDDSPVAGAVVSVRRWLPYDLSRIAETKTGPDGVYTIDGLPPGRATVEATIPSAPWSNGRTFDPRPGTTTSMDLCIDEGVTVEGICRDAETLEPIVGAACSLSWTMSDAVNTGNDGKFTMTNANRHHFTTTVYVRAKGYGKEIALARMTDGPKLSAVVSMRRSHAVVGRIVDREGAPIPRVHVAAIATHFGSNGQWSDWIGGESRDDGRFSLDGLGDRARHAVLARKEGFGDRVYDLPSAELATPSYDVGDIVLHPAAHISGVVVDTEGKPLARAHLEISGCNFDRLIRNGDEPPTEIDGFDYAQSRTVMTDDLGRFDIVDLAEGVYEITGTTLEGRLIERVSVSIKDGEHESDVRIVCPKDVVGDSSILGIVVDDAGNPVPFATVSFARNDSIADYHGYNHFGADGKFSFFGLPAGNYSLEADILFAGFDPRQRPNVATKIYGIAAGSRDVRLVMRRAEKISGRVEDSSDRPVPFAVINVTDVETGERQTIGSDIFGRFTAFVAAGSVSTLEAGADAPVEEAVGEARRLTGRLDAICAGAEGVRIEVR